LATTATQIIQVLKEQLCILHHHHHHRRMLLKACHQSRRQLKAIKRCSKNESNRIHPSNCNSFPLQQQQQQLNPLFQVIQQTIFKVNEETLFNTKQIIVHYSSKSSVPIFKTPITTP
jgi:hypothetical protein